jgi:hypothetical protein
MSDQRDVRDPTTQAREALEIVCSGNIARLSDYYGPDLVDHVNDVVHLGHEGLYESFDLYRGIFDEWHFTVDEQVTEGNRVASRWVLHGTCRGRQVELRGLTLSRVDECGHVVEDWGFADTLSLLQKLGFLRTVLLGLKVVTGRVRVPKGEPVAG